jgi:hypothetical protein
MIKNIIKGLIMKYVLLLSILLTPHIFAKKNHEIDREETPIACMVSGITYPEKNHLKQQTKKKKTFTKHWRQDASQDTSETSEEKAELGSLKNENAVPIIDMPSSAQAPATKTPDSENQGISSAPSLAMPNVTNVTTNQISKLIFNGKKRAKQRRASNRDFRRRRPGRIVEEEQCTLCSSKELQPTPIVQASQPAPQYTRKSSALYDKEKAPEQL